MQYNPDPNGIGLPSNVVPKEFPTEVHDLRSLPNPAAVTSIDTTGFQVVDKALSKTDMQYDDWESEEKITKQYYGEVER